jgi:Ca2+-binding EF-hand superfamily protein
MYALLFGKEKATNDPPPPDYISLSQKSNFTKGELKHLYLRFNSICNQETRLVERIPFLQQPELTFCPLMPLAFGMELRNYNSERIASQDNLPIAQESSSEVVEYLGLNFEYFVKILSVFSQKASNNEKLSCMIFFTTSFIIFHRLLRSH